MIRRVFAFVFAVAACQVFGAVDLRMTPDGGLAFDGGAISVCAYRPGWSGYAMKADWKDCSSAVRRFAICDGETSIFKGLASWTMQDDGTVKGSVSLECVAPVEVQCIALAASIPTVPAFGLGDGKAQEYELPTAAGDSRPPAGGQILLLRFDGPVRYHAQDSRIWGKQWTVRFGERRGRRTYVVGDRIEWKMTLSSQDGLRLKRMEPCVIAADDGWVKMDYRTDIKPGSALDLSAQGLQDAPAGKYGWLKSVGGHFEFEGLPGVEQRFYGVNLCFTANYLDHATADMLIDRLVRCGYNAVRVHHHDGGWVASAENREKLDYLISKCIERGLYITTDLYVSRPVKWREIGIDRDGEMNKQLYKTYIGIHEPAFSNWCANAQAFLEHVNPYTGRAYKDEPAMPFISLVNEGKLAMNWSEKKKDKLLAAAWLAFGGTGEPPEPWGGRDQEAHRRFDEWVNGRVWGRCSAFVRKLGARALLTNDNNGRWHGEGEDLTPHYDYVDTHFYVDHPEFIEQKWRLPSKCGNRNPIVSELPPLLHRGYAKGASKPYTISEWNFSGPGRYRGMGGILTGALAAEQEWDGLWRFAYSHSNANLKDNPNGRPGYFDCVTDPIIAASDRASVCLYLRRDATVGSLKTDKESGSMTLVSPCTCGGFAEGGLVDAGPLSFTVCTNTTVRRAVPTTLWVSTLDGKAIRESSRMLLTHLTDVQGAEAKFADETRTILLKWGRGCLAEIGAADVSLRLAEPQRYQVWALASDGERRFEVPCRVEKGALCFTASVAGPNGAQLFYEIVRLAH